MKYLIVLVAFVTGCEKEGPAPEPIAPEPPPPLVEQAKAADVGTTDSVAVPAASEPFQGKPRELDGTPYEHIEGELLLKYEGPSGAFDLFRTAGDRQSVSGKAHLETGMEVDVRRSKVFVKVPRVLTAKRDLDVIAKRWDRVASRSGKEDVLHISQGQEVQLLKSTEEGHCWFSVVNDDFVAGCPVIEDFDGEKWDGTPLAVDYEWWVKTAISGAQGWLPVDEVSFSWVKKPAKKR